MEQRSTCGQNSFEPARLFKSTDDSSVQTCCSSRWTAAIFQDWEKLRRNPGFRGWSLPSSRTVILKIGWNNLTSAAGFPVKKPYKRHNIIRALRLYKRKTGTVPSAPRFDAFRNEHPELRLPDSGRVKREFQGSFVAARQAAGL